MAAVLIGSLAEENEDPISGLFVARSGISDSPMMLHFNAKVCIPKGFVGEFPCLFPPAAAEGKSCFSSKSEGWGGGRLL